MTATTKTAAELRAAMRDVPDDAPVLLVLHSAPDSRGAPRAGWLGAIRYDDGGHTLDLHDSSVCATGEFPVPVIPMQGTDDEDAYPRECT